jgi:hypothetical protein
MLSSIRLTNTGKIPLSLYSVGGLSLVLNFIECPLNCDSCPWESNIGRRSARLIEFNPQIIVKLAKQYGVDIIFLHGAEPYNYISYDDVKRIKDESSIAMGFKINPLIAEGNSRFISMTNFIDVALFEIVLNSDIELQTKSLMNIMHSSIVQFKHIEVAVVVMGGKNNLGLINTLKNVINIVKKNDIPINIVLINNMYKVFDINLINRLREEYPLIQIPTAEVFENASTICPRCKNIVIIRRGGIVYKVNIDDIGKCIFCGYKLVNSMSKKLVKLPLDIPLV